MNAWTFGFAGLCVLLGFLYLLLHRRTAHEIKTILEALSSFVRELATFWRRPAVDVGQLAQAVEQLRPSTSSSAVEPASSTRPSALAP